jgi:8-amino-7-oxononanoate synthase
VHPLLRSVREALARLDAKAERRTIARPEGVDFASNDYLGLRDDPRVCRAAAAAIEEFGFGAGAARLLRGDHPAHRALEERFAAWQGTEDALLFGSGFLANYGVLQALGAEGWTILSDADNHASIIDGCRAARANVVKIRHNDAGAFAAAVTPRTIIVTEAVFSMRGDRAPVDAIAARCPDAALVVDEAHAAGLFPPAGRAMVRVTPCGKALGAAGAVVAGPRDVIELLRSRCRTFLFSTAPPPAVAAAILAAVEIVEAEPERAARALALARRVRADAASCIVPVPCRDTAHALAMQGALRERGFDVRAVRPPTVRAAMLRVSVHASRTDAEVDGLRAALADLGLLA